jgi:hypothetical protein
VSREEAMAEDEGMMSTASADEHRMQEGEAEEPEVVVPRVS